MVKINLKKWPMRIVEYEEEQEEIQEILSLYQMYKMTNEKNPFEECIYKKKSNINERNSSRNSFTSSEDDSMLDDEQFKRDASPGLKKM
jgi:hypothetical protein